MEAEGCPHVIVPMTRAITPWQDLKCLVQLYRMMRRERPDIVHTHTPKAGLLGMLAARMAGVPIRIHTVAGMPLMTAVGWQKKLLFASEKLTYWAAGYIWPNSKSLRQFILEHRMTAVEKVQMMGQGSSNGIDLAKFSTDRLNFKKLEEVKEQIGYDARYTWILAVGRLVVDKGIRELVDSFAALKNSFPDLRLLLVGPMEQERPEETLPDAIVRSIQQHPDIVHITWSDEIAGLMHLADIFVHPSHREGFPNVLLQAGAMCCPIVCSDIPGNRDIVTHQQTGLLFEVKNVNDLSEKLCYALNHSQQCLEYASTLRQKIERYYERGALHERIYLKYKELLTKHAR